ncbi:IMP-specific 5'-nucleotidase 1 isoform X2 [Cryptomeria japonica]|uniref:IMP-specific 5'-nucleotidase 1 isoform X2 n=1 Tax=Cryptomeria japonica TaxID=3369 RepID=UPI0027D9F865|nr:IMP-specific 5'-nucleotidase 1 isoform X2 [Cryptomeria japonica]
MIANTGLVCINSTVLNPNSLSPLFHHVNACPGALQGHHHVRGSIPGKNVASMCCSAPPSATAVVAADSDQRLVADVEDGNADVDGDGDGSSKAGAASGESEGGRLRWNMLLSTEALGDAHLLRAGSVTDAHVLRRKGRLKEQDGLIEFVVSMHNTHSPSEVMEKMERWVREHFEDPRRSTLSRLVPSIGRFHTSLPLIRAMREYDEFAMISRRKFVPPNFAEIRHVLNIAQVHAIAERISFVTFDADGTLYADGHHIEGDNKMIDHIVKFMQHGAHVAIVTAAGYPENSLKFEDRIAGLLTAFKELGLPPSITNLFHVMGGECNYLLRVNDNYGLEFVEDKLWQSEDMLHWKEQDIQKLLDDAQCALKSASARLHLPVEIVRKPRAVGAIPKEPTIYEVLEEMALTVQMQLVDAELPFCAFNGGVDVFVDIGNKSVGLGALMSYLHKRPYETLHIGDRFTVSGNDSATRSKCSILWVANPDETAFYTRMLLQDMRLARLTPYIE